MVILLQNVFKNHINVNHTIKFIVSLDDSDIKINIVLERDLNNDVGFTNICNYNLYYGWVIYFYDSIYEQIKDFVRVARNPMALSPTMPPDNE